MNSGAKEKQKIFEAILSSPGMSEQCKVGLSLSRQNILVLCRLIENGLSNDTEGADDMLGLISPESKEQLRVVVPEFLRRSGLTEFYEKLKQL